MSITSTAPPGSVARFNEWLAARGTRAFGTMWAFYVFTVYGLLPVVDPAHQVQYLLYSNALQLVALPLLAVGAVVLGRATERRDMETHDAEMEALALIREDHAALAGLVASMATLVGELHAAAAVPVEAAP